MDCFVSLAMTGGFGTVAMMDAGRNVFQWCALYFMLRRAVGAAEPLQSGARWREAAQ
ncbi:MAG: hypothetical protein SOT81_02855 [Treponema sp.]|nr:hypothetical protein [Treponema sp.]